MSRTAVVANPPIGLGLRDPAAYRSSMIAPLGLPARTDVVGLAGRSVGAAADAAASLAGVASPLAPDPVRVSVAYSSERWFRVDGEPVRAFAPLSGFFRTRDGWVRTHGNYPHHRAALLRGLGLSPRDGDPADERDAVASALARWETASVVTAVAPEHGLCVAVRPEDPRADAALRSTPVVAVSPLGDAAPVPLPQEDPAAPLRGVRVLDLTRVIAGPVATRTLALLGAQVLRLDPPRLPELPNQHLDTGHGKRSALLDVATPAGAARFDELLAAADVVALGYRPAALDRLGLSPEALAARHPGTIVLRLSAWGEPDRRGFDSLVQAACGVALIESAAGEPGALPAQALDHSAGYLLAAAAMRLLHRRARNGGSWLAETSLRRVAAELLGMPRTDAPEPPPRIGDPADHTQTFDVLGTRITTAAPAVRYPGGPVEFAPPRAWGGDEPAWW